MPPGTAARTRRETLKLTGGVLAILGTSGLAAGNQELTKVNVGFSAPSGRRAAVSRADEVNYEFAFNALTIRVSENAIDALRRREDIRYVEPDAQMEALAQTLPWGIDRVDAEVVHDSGETGNGADIAIIDTGIASDHPDLQANLGEGVSFLGGVQTSSWEDDNGHGTHVAGIADAIDNDEGVVGVSTGATLHAVKVLSASGVGFTSDIAKGIEWTADQGYDVGNLSLGGGDSDLLADAVAYAYGAGVLLAAAAGNDGECTDCVSYPAAYQECLAVSATTKQDDLASFSSQGPEVELAAPGEGIYSTYLGGTYTELSGTSMACPHVAGAAGQLMATGDANTEARNRLTSTAEDIGLSSNEAGAGLLDVENAVLGTTSGDDLGSDGGNDSDTAPTGSIERVNESESKSPHAEFDVSWNARDDDGDLDSVELTLTDTETGTTDDSRGINVSGTDASDTTVLTAKHADGEGHTYEVELTVTDANGTTATDSATVSENGS